MFNNNNNKNNKNVDPRYMDYQQNPNMNNMYPGLEINRLIYEIPRASDNHCA